jgi:hypothetical protein
MPRQLAIGRVPAVGRKLAIGRKPIGFVSDGKVHAVLDTNIIIYALEALFKNSTASQIEKDSLEIICLVEKDILVIGINAKLFAEYRKVAERIASESRTTSQDLGYIINLIEKKAVSVRMLVDPQRVSPHKNDDILFDGLSTSYLVSNNLSDVDPSKLLRSSSYQATFTPSNFLKELRSKKII